MGGMRFPLQIISAPSYWTGQISFKWFVQLLRNLLYGLASVRVLMDPIPSASTSCVIVELPLMGRMGFPQ